MDFSKQRYAFCMEWDGSGFAGWQLQSEGPGFEGVVTIQSVFEKALATALRRHGERFPVDGCGRLDAGVHAEEFYAHADLPAGLGNETLENFRHKVNCLLPDGVVVTRMFPVSQDWHARRSSAGKIYLYKLFVRRSKPTLLKNKVLWIPVDTDKPEFFDDSKLKLALDLFVGTHDFFAFAAANFTAKTSVRTITKIELTKNGAVYEIKVHGTGFLKQMVRNIVGSCIEVAQHKRSIESIRSLLGMDGQAVGKRHQAGLCADAHALYLHKVIYNDTIV